MSAVQARPVPAGRPDQRVTFVRILRSEWIKLVSLRSTIWCAALIVVLTVGAGALLALALAGNADLLVQLGADQLQVTAATLGARFTQLIACILGVLVIGGEYATGMIRTTFVSVPKRWPAIAAKLLVLAVAVFAVAEIAAALTLAVTGSVFAAHGVPLHLGRPAVLLPLLGDGLYLALIAVFACLIGVAVRNSALGIAIVLALVLVVPTVFSIASALSRATWLANVSAVLPSSAGERLFDYTAASPGGVSAGVLTLTPGFAVLVLVGWIVLAALVALPLALRRDA